MKLAIIAHPRHAIRSPFAGGLEAFTSDIVNYYSTLFDVTLFAHPHSEVNCKVISFDYPENDIGKFPDLIENDFMLKTMQYIERHSFDVIHNNSLNPIPILWASKKDIPILTTLHTPPYSKLKAATVLASYAPNTHFTAVSQSLADAWAPFINDRIDVTYNGIDLRKWLVTKNAKDFVFSYGRILPNKGFDLAIDAAHLLNIPIKIAGPISDEHYMQTQVFPKLKPCDEYLGHIDHALIKHTLAKSRAAVFGTRWDEPFGLSTIEALATKTPVASFNRGAFPEILGKGAGCLANGTTVKSLASALSETIDFNGDDALQSATKFPLNKMCQQYCEKLSSIS